MPTNKEKNQPTNTPPPPEVPRFNRHPLTPMQRDQIILGAAYGDSMDIALDFLALVDIRDHALRYIESRGLLADFIQAHRIATLRQARV